MICAATCTGARLSKRKESVGNIADPVERMRLELQLFSILFYVCVQLFIRKTAAMCNWQASLMKYAGRLGF